MSSSHPHDPPPTYEDAIAPTSGLQRVSTDGPSAHTTRNGIPPERRRSMEDENRPLPPGWIRQFDPTEQHQFFVDTRATPPRSIWVHPYDDPDFLSTLSPEERKKHSRIHRSVTLNDLAAEDTDSDNDSIRKHSAAPGPSGTNGNSSGSNNSNLPPRPDAEPTGIHKFGRKMKDRLTSTTHDEREATRAERAEQERRAYIMHLRAREAMARAMETGQPQFLCKDERGRDLYIEPPMGYRGYGNNAYGYNPYAQGPYTNPNARFLRPAGPYGRPYGYGYGGGIGAPVAAGVLGGALLGGLLF